MFDVFERKIYRVMVCNKYETRCVVCLDTSKRKNAIEVAKVCYDNFDKMDKGNGDRILIKKLTILELKSNWQTIKTKVVKNKKGVIRYGRTKKIKWVNK